MFDSIRNHKKYLMGFLMILIIPSFVLFGVQGFTDFNQRGETVATVDGHDITQADWDQAHRRRVAAPARADAQPGPQTARQRCRPLRHAGALVRDRVLAAAVQKDHLYTSDQRLARALQETEHRGAAQTRRHTRCGALQATGGPPGLTPEGSRRASVPICRSGRCSVACSPPGLCPLLWRRSPSTPFSSGAKCACWRFFARTSLRRCPSPTPTSSSSTRTTRRCSRRRSRSMSSTWCSTRPNWPGALCSTRTTCGPITRRTLRDCRVTRSGAPGTSC
jgi:hypothetical protein